MPQAFVLQAWGFVARIVTTIYCYKRPPKQRKPVADVSVIVMPSIRSKAARLGQAAAKSVPPSSGSGCRRGTMFGSLSIDEGHVLAVLAGVVFGAAAISTACWVWLRKQIFAFGASALCGSGVVLLGLSIWHSVEFGINGNSIPLKLQSALQTIDTKIATLDQALQQNSAAVADLKQIDAKVAAIDQALQQNSAAAADLKQIDAKVAAIDQALQQNSATAADLKQIDAEVAAIDQTLQQINAAVANLQRGPRRGASPRRQPLR
jgi:hypothetical protein